MIIGGLYSFNNGENFINQHFQDEFNEVQEVIKNINALEHKTKTSKEKTMIGNMLYSPSSLNKAFKKEFSQRNWQSKKILCSYSQNYYTSDYKPSNLLTKNKSSPFREMDFLKDKVGVEVQFGKYAFMVYNVCAKMTIFHNRKIIDVGIEIVPLKEFADEMSTGVSYFEQIVWDLENRGIADIDIPVVILGLTKNEN